MSKIKLLWNFFPHNSLQVHVIIPLVEYVSMDERLEVAANLERLRQKASKEPCEHLLAVITQMLPETPTLPLWGEFSIISPLHIWGRGVVSRYISCLSNCLFFKIGDFRTYIQISCILCYQDTGYKLHHLLSWTPEFPVPCKPAARDFP